MNQLVTRQQIPVSLEEAWDFFSSPRNLQKITPADMKFEVNPGFADEMYEGMIIAYIVSPLFRIPMKWVTEITHIREPFFFVDHQVQGPFRFWHHQHHFKEIPGGVEMADIVNYAAPFGIIGKLTERMIVDRRVKGIFEYRRKILEGLFGRMSGNR